MESIIKTRQTIIKNWWLMLVLGILLLIGGIFTIWYSTPSIIFLTTFFSISFLVLGALEVVFSLSNTHTHNWGWYFVGGLLDLAVGLILISSNIFTQMAILAFFIGFWLMFKGIQMMGLSFDLQSQKVRNWGWMLALGIIELLLSFTIIMLPVTGLAALLVWVSISLIFIGIYYIGLSFNLRRLKNKVNQLETE